MTTLIMDKPKGGRGHTAPYETKQMRVPTGLESQIQELVSRYRNWISEAGTRIAGTNNPPSLLDKSSNTSTQEPVYQLLNKVDDLNKLVDNLKLDIASLESERNTLNHEIDQLHAQNGELHLEVAELKEQLKAVDKLNSTKSNTSELADLESDRDRFFASLRLGKQSPEYKRIKKAVDQFIVFVQSS